MIEKKQTGKISVREKLELKIHLAVCPCCRVFEQQSIGINKLVHQSQVMKGSRLKTVLKRNTKSKYGKTREKLTYPKMAPRDKLCTDRFVFK